MAFLRKAGENRREKISVEQRLKAYFKGGRSIIPASSILQSICDMKLCEDGRSRRASSPAGACSSPTAASAFSSLTVQIRLPESTVTCASWLAALQSRESHFRCGVREFPAFWLLRLIRHIPADA